MKHFQKLLEHDALWGSFNIVGRSIGKQTMGDINCGCIAECDKHKSKEESGNVTQ